MLELESVEGTSMSRRFLDALLGEETLMQPQASNIEEIQNIRDSVYLTTMQFGDEAFRLVIDTGSSDTWLAGSNFQCISMLTKAATSASSCRLARTYNVTKTYKKVPNLHFNISYADGEFLNGDMGQETIGFGGIVVPEQEFGLVNLAAWNGDSVSSGLTGLAFPSVTRAYPGTIASADKKGGNVPYDPIFTNMWKRKLVAPYFSVALNRAGERAGVIALGGLPSGDIKYETDFAKAPMQHLMIQQPSTAGNAQDYQLYVVETDGWEVTSPGGTRAEDVAKSKTKVVLDTGTTLSYLPANIANAINRSFDPPAQTNPQGGNIMVRCNAKAPKVAVRIGGKQVWFDPKDIIMNLGRTGSTNMCMSGVQATKSAVQPSILGGTLMKNVVTVFDIGAGEMRFANRIR
jgi:hypothetical protein